MFDSILNTSVEFISDHFNVILSMSLHPSIVDDSSLASEMDMYLTLRST